MQRSQKITLEGYIEVRSVDLDAVIDALPAHIDQTREEPGCEVFSVTPSAEYKNRFDVYEVFTDRAAFNAHQQRVRSSAWGALTTNVTRHYRVTEG